MRFNAWLSLFYAGPPGCTPLLQQRLNNGPNCYYYLLHQIKEQRNKIHEAIEYIALPPYLT